MKKICLLFVLMIASAASVLAVDKVTATVLGKTLKIGLENETTFCAFQMDITLPAGVSAEAVEAVANRLSQEGSDTEIGGTKFIVAHNTLEGNVLRVIAYNLANAQIENATGDILSITLSANVDDPSLITVSNIIFVDANDLEEVKLSDAMGKEGIMLGDVTGEGEINILDLGAVIDIMLGKDVAGYKVAAADLDGNSEYNILDLGLIIDIMLGK